MVTFGLVRQTSVLTTNSVPSHVFTIHVNAPGVKFDARDVSNDMQKRFEKDLGIKEGERWFARITYDDQEGDDVQNESKLFQADLTLISKRDLKSTQVWVDTQTKKISVVDQNQASPTSRVMQRLGSFLSEGCPSTSLFHTRCAYHVRCDVVCVVIRINNSGMVVANTVDFVDCHPGPGMEGSALRPSFLCLIIVIKIACYCFDLHSTTARF